MKPPIAPILLSVAGSLVAAATWIGAHAAPRLAFCSCWGGTVVATSFFGGLGLTLAGLIWLVVAWILRNRKRQA